MQIVHEQGEETPMRQEGYEVAYPVSAAEAMPYERAAFIRRTYAHLAGAILAFAALEAVLLQFITPKEVFGVLNQSPYSWLMVLGLFLVAGWVAQWWASSETSRPLQYAGLALYVVLEALIFLPILSIAVAYFDPMVIPTAGIMTLAVAGGLTLSVFITKKDYSFLGPILCVSSLIALGVIVAGVLLGFTLGVFFAFAMVALMSGYILYYTSNVLHHYRTDQHVAAALALFAAIATLFWWILRIVMAFSSRD
jgi:FtsH-binding integral membrane protein